MRVVSVVDTTVAAPDRRRRTSVTEELKAALRSGELTEDQLRELIAVRADRLGLTFEQAVAAFHSDTLPRSADGADLALLISMLDPGLLRANHLINFSAWPRSRAGR